MQHTLIAVIVILVLLVIVLAVLLGIFLGRHYFCRCRHHYHCEQDEVREQRHRQRIANEEEREGVTYECNPIENTDDVVIGSDTSALRERRQQRRRWQHHQHDDDECNSHEEYNNPELHEYSNNNIREVNDVLTSSLHQNNNNNSNENNNVANRLEIHSHEPTLLSSTSNIMNTNMPSTGVLSNNALVNINRNVLHNNRPSANSIHNMISPTSTNGVHSENESNVATATRYSPVELTGVAIENRIRPRSHLPKGTVVVEHEDRQYIIHFSEIEEIPQAAPPPLSAEELSFIEAARHRVASPEFYGRAEYMHGSYSSSLKGLPLRRNDSAASVCSLSAYDSNVDNFNKSINRSNYHVNNSVNEGNTSMTSENYKAWHALHAPYFYNNNNNGDNKSIHGALSNGSIASLANYSFRLASQAGSLYHADESSSSHNSKEYKYSANNHMADKENKTSSYNNNNDYIDKRRIVKESNVVSVENLIRQKEDGKTDKNKVDEVCVSKANKQNSHTNIKENTSVIAADTNEYENEKGYKSSCSDDDNDSQRAQNTFMRHQQMRLAYYTDPARHQRMTNLYNTKQNSNYSKKDANRKSTNNNNDDSKKSNNEEQIPLNNVMQERLLVNSNKSNTQNNERWQVKHQQERKKRHDAYESTSDDMEDSNNNNNNNNSEVEQIQRVQLLRRQQRRQLQEKQQQEEHINSLTLATKRTQEEQQNAVETKNNKQKKVRNNILCSQDVDSKYKMTIIAPMLNEGSITIANNNRYNNQRYVLPLTALGLEQITNYTIDHNDAGASSKELTVSSSLPAPSQLINVEQQQHEEEMNDMYQAASKVEQDNKEDNTTCVLKKTAVVPLSEVIIVPAATATATPFSCSTSSSAAEPSLLNNAQPVNIVLQNGQVQDTLHVRPISHADLSLAPAEKDTNPEKSKQGKN